MFGPDWDVKVGAGFVYAPDYEGSDDYEFKFLPSLSIEYDDWLKADLTDLSISATLFSSQFDGVEVRAGGFGRYRPGRDADDSDEGDLDGLGDVDAAVELGLFAEAKVHGVTFEVKIAQDVVDSHDGTLVELDLSYDTRLDQRLVMSIGAETTWASNSYVESYFGITQQQSSASGYSAYDPGSGFTSAGPYVDFTYILTREIFVSTFAGYRRMFGEAGNSPIVSTAGSRNQFYGGLMLTYRF